MHGEKGFPVLAQRHDAMGWTAGIQSVQDLSEEQTKHRVRTAVQGDCEKDEWGEVPVSKCDNCEVRKVYAKLFDMHWMGEDDCPVECKEDDEDKEVTP